MHSWLKYYDSLFICLSKSSINRLQSTKRYHVALVFISLHMLPIQFRIHFKFLVITFRACNKERLRSYNKDIEVKRLGFASVPHSRLKTEVDCSFEAVAPTL